MITLGQRTFFLAKSPSPSRTINRSRCILLKDLSEVISYTSRRTEFVPISNIAKRVGAVLAELLIVVASTTFAGSKVFPSTSKTTVNLNTYTRTAKEGVLPRKYFRCANGDTNCL